MDFFIYKVNTVKLSNLMRTRNLIREVRLNEIEFLIFLIFFLYHDSVRPNKPLDLMDSMQTRFLTQFEKKI
jgi:hypothetical protein